MYLIFDTETTGLPRDYKAPVTDTDNWPRCIQIAWQLHDEWGRCIEHQDFLIRPDGFDVPFDAEKIHGISTALAQEKGVPIQEAFAAFNEALNRAQFIVGQNIDFDINIMGCEMYRYGVDSKLMTLPALDTCTERTAELCKLPGGRGGKFKLPTLTELHEFLFQEAFQEAHNATADVEATARCFLELVRREEFTLEELKTEKAYFEKFREFNTAEIALIGLKHINLREQSSKLVEKTEAPEVPGDLKRENLEDLKDVAFTHLHNHSQFTILEATTKVDELLSKAIEYNMPAVALTDAGNMMGAFNFVRAVQSYNRSLDSQGEKKPLVPIVGCEFNVCEDHTNKNAKDNGHQVVLLAKNMRGYQNLCKLSSISFTNGFYYVPRIDKTLLKEYKEDLICLSGGINGEVPFKILNVGENQAEEAFLWWKEVFGDDFYAELMRHGLEEEERVNQTLLKFCEKHGVKYVATNNTFYPQQKDSKPHDILLCVKEGAKLEDPVGRGRGFRRGLPNDQFYFKSQDEMKKLFADLPEAIINTEKIVKKCEPYDLERDVLLPNFEIPAEFVHEEDQKDGEKRGENAYLRHLTYEGAKKRYGEISPEISERIDFELETIARTGYPGYFLIVQDFCNKAREMGVAVGPGRGSAAGSVVAYCTGITNVDPIKYDLLFERFLNPDRVSMPDIDIDFDDDGRAKVIEYVINKYGANQVAQIITYGTMAAKSSIRDTARVLDLPLFEADRVAKLVPSTPGVNLAKLLAMSEVEMKEKLNSDDFESVKQLLDLSKGNDLASQVVNQARELEGSMRNTGIHACGVIITPDDITNYVPIATAKDSDLYCTQFDNAVVESAGMLKMDFLGLKTLTLIRDTIKIIKHRHGIELIPDEIPLDDAKTYELFQKGDTVGIFQFESPGMQKHLKALKPDKFGDLIAMNALYRPGPLEYIPNFIARKHGDEEISYDTPEMEEYLAETYGITVYQEQVMLLSQKLAGFTKGMADALRKAMGKKKKEILDELKPKFVDGCAANNIGEEVAEKIWRDWEAFAAYAFNKSHSTCYSVIAFHTAYLKAHYPAEYMASVLSNNLNDIKQVTFFMDECRRMGIEVLGPDVNESVYEFTVNKEGAIRFGLGAIKGVGKYPVESIISARSEHGAYNSVFDFSRKVDLRTCNKKVFESLALAGAFDSFKDIHRAQYFEKDLKDKIFLENVMRYGANYQEMQNSNQVSLFGESSEVDMPEPEIPVSKEWGNFMRLKKEKEVIGIFISGHPLDDYKLEIKHLCNASVSDLNNLEEWGTKEMVFIAAVNAAEHRISRKGNEFGKMIIEDYNDVAEIMLFGDDYIKFKPYLSAEARYLFKGSVSKTKWGERKLEFKINQIIPAEQAKDMLASEFRLSLSAEEVSYGMVEDLFELFSKNPGKCRLRFQIKSNQDTVQLTSKTIKVGVSDEIITTLQSMGIEEIELA